MNILSSIAIIYPPQKKNVQLRAYKVKFTKIGKCCDNLMSFFLFSIQHDINTFTKNWDLEIV